MMFPLLIVNIIISIIIIIITLFLYLSTSPQIASPNYHISNYTSNSLLILRPHKPKNRNFRSKRRLKCRNGT